MCIQSLWCRLTQIYILYVEPIRVPKKKKKEKNPDADTMYTNTSLRVTQKACVAHGQILLQ